MKKIFKVDFDDGSYLSYESGDEHVVFHCHYFNAGNPGELFMKVEDFLELADSVEENQG